MRFSQFAGTAIVPLLARLVLAFVFITFGYNKLFTTTTFNAQDAAVLQELGVPLEPVQVDPVTDDDADDDVAMRSQHQPVIRLASYQDDAGQDDAGQDDADAGAADDEASDAASSDAAATGPPPPLDGPRQAKTLHRITVLLYGQHPEIPKPDMAAWAAAITELVGGGLLLIGLFSRFWGLGLAITMLVACYMTTIQIHGLHTANPLSATPDMFEAYKGAGLQLGMFVLAIGIALTGPGPLSLDRVLFGRSGGGDDDGLDD